MCKFHQESENKWVSDCGQYQIERSRNYKGFQGRSLRRYAAYRDGLRLHSPDPILSFQTARQYCIHDSSKLHIQRLNSSI